MSVKRVLVVDDEKNMQTVLKILFDGEGFQTVCVDDGLQALALLDSGERFGVIMSDFKMDGMDGLTLLRGIRERGLQLPFVLMTAHGTIEKAVEAMKLGAVDVVTKPFTKELVLAIVSRIIKLESLEDENRILKAALKQDELIYCSPAMTEIATLITRIGPVAAPVLLTGESGTGKEVVARNIHRAYGGGSFDARPFVSVNCPAVPESLLESELFGYRKGAFTGANQDFKGKVELADGGTVFFDEIGDLPAGLQPKLLRLMENRTYEPLGSGKTKKVDIRVICATNRNMKRLVRNGIFREDLLYRINTFTIEIPPLRDRREDVPVLAEFFLSMFASEMRKPIKGISAAAREVLQGYAWPGNIRELRNVLERAVVLCAGKDIELEDLPQDLRFAASAQHDNRGGGSAIETVERSLIVDALESAKGNISAAARILGVTRNTLRYRIRKYDIDVELDQDE
jgi:two-component system, NtrC family, response regulator AtoC